MPRGVLRSSGISSDVDLDTAWKETSPPPQWGAGGPSEAMEQVLPVYTDHPSCEADDERSPVWMCVRRWRHWADFCAHAMMRVCVCACFISPALRFFFFFSLPFSSSPPLLSCSNGTLREKTKKNCWCVYVFKFSSVVGVVHWCAWLDRFCDLCEIMRGCFVLEHLSALWEIAYNFFYFAFVVDWRAKIKRSSFCWNKWVFLHSLYCVKCGFFFSWKDGDACCWCLVNIVFLNIHLYPYGKAFWMQFLSHYLLVLTNLLN